MDQNIPSVAQVQADLARARAEEADLHARVQQAEQALQALQKQLQEVSPWGGGKIRGLEKLLVKARRAEVYDNAPEVPWQKEAGGWDSTGTCRVLRATPAQIWTLTYRGQDPASPTRFDRATGYEGRLRGPSVRRINVEEALAALAQREQK